MATIKQDNEAQSKPQDVEPVAEKQPVSILVIFVAILIEILLFGLSNLKEYKIVGHVIPPTIAIFGLVVYKLDHTPYFSFYGVVAAYGCFAFDLLKITGEDASTILHGIDIAIQVSLLVAVGYYIVLMRIRHDKKERAELAILAFIIATFLVPQAKDPGSVTTLALLLVILSWNTQLLFLFVDPNFELSPKSAAILSLPLMRLHHVLLVGAFAVVFAVQTVRIYTLFSNISPESPKPKIKQPFLEEDFDIETNELPPPALEETKALPKTLTIQPKAPPKENAPKPPPPPKPKKLLETYSYIHTQPQKPKTPVLSETPKDIPKSTKPLFSAYQPQ